MVGVITDGSFWNSKALNFWDDMLTKEGNTLLLGGKSSKGVADDFVNRKCSLRKETG